MGLLKFLKALIRKTPEYPVYIGHSGSKIYHRDDCEYGSSIGRRHGRVFESQARAVEIGYQPCKVCKPDRSPYSPGEWVPNLRE
jgi:methylphosphotriester-DNA--protein-cysteine methyltransferase